MPLSGNLHEPVDKDSRFTTRKLKMDLLEEGINEAGAMSSFNAAGSAYANYGVPMIPFFVYYSMFGFQRIRFSMGFQRTFFALALYYRDTSVDLLKE